MTRCVQTSKLVQLRSTQKRPHPHHINRQFRLDSVELLASTLRTQKALCPGKVLPIVKVSDQDPVTNFRYLPFPPVSAQLERFSGSFEWLGHGVSVCETRMFDENSPGFMKGSYRSAMRIVLAEIEGRSHQAIMRSFRGWKLFLLLPRLLLHRFPRGGKIPKTQLQCRMEAFSRGPRQIDR